MKKHVVDKEYEARFIISRCSDGTFSLELTDNLSGVRVVEMRLSALQFASAITSSYTEVKAKYGFLPAVGKKYETKTKQVTVPTETWKKEVLVDLLIKHAEVDEGWHLDTYLNRQGQLKNDGPGKTIITYSIYRFVEPEDV